LHYIRTTIHPIISENAMHKLAADKVFVNCSTIPIKVLANAQKHSGDVSQLTPEAERLRLRSIPPATKPSTVLVGVSWRFR
jgi:hypothetical protein